MIEVFGEEYSSVNAACKHFGISTSYVSRIKKRTGETHKQIIEEIVTRKNSRDSLPYNRSKYYDILKEHGYSSIKRLSIDTGIAGSTLRERLEAGMPFEEVVSKKPICHREPVTVFGETYKTKQDACREYDVCYATIYHKGIIEQLTFEEAFEAYVNKRRNRAKH